MGLGTKDKASGVKKISTKIDKNMKSIFDTAKEPLLVLDNYLEVLYANSMFLDAFELKREDIMNKSFDRLVNTKWNISELKKILNETLTNDINMYDFEINFICEKGNNKNILLNATLIEDFQWVIITAECISCKSENKTKSDKKIQNIETAVKKRTVKLCDRLNMLEILNKNMVGRELKMIQMKKEIKDLKRQIINGK